MAGIGGSFARCAIPHIPYLHIIFTCKLGTLTDRATRATHTSPMARTTEHCDQIAPLLAVGRSVAYISNELGLSRGIIRIRLETMRLVLADELSDTSWLDVERRTAVEVGQAWGRR